MIRVPAYWSSPTTTRTGTQAAPWQETATNPRLVVTVRADHITEHDT
ncbi:hypothetical protein ACFXDH_45130 [Streptomyces sp. NPDC059467]